MATYDPAVFVPVFAKVFIEHRTALARRGQPGGPA
jgi:hypothetical protein